MMASVLTIISSPSWLWVGEIVEAISIVVIGIGCAGEVWADHHKFADAFSSPSPITYSKDKWRRIFGMMVVGGLVIELFAFGLSFLASNREIEGLHKANLELQAKLQPRIITKKQISDFIFLTEKISKKMPIKIYACSEGDDTYQFARHIRSMFDKAGFPRDSSRDGVAEDLTENLITHVSREIGWTNEWPSVFLLRYGTNDLIYCFNDTPKEVTNGFIRGCSESFCKGFN